jgi:Fur family ferric uptake transcriptional regulator
MSKQDVQPVGQRQTRQRDAILKVIDESHGPLTVPEIHRKARKGLKQLGIATVYRTVKLLVEAKHIHTVILPDGETRFESTEGHHDHFRCRLCGQVFDLHHCPMDLPVGTILPEGFRIEDHELTLYGTCPKCTK